MSKKLVLIGAGHAHMVTLANLDEFKRRGHEVIVIGPSPYHYYSGMGPGMLGRIYTPEDIRFASKQVVEKYGGRFVLGKALKINPEKREVILESGEAVAYDVLSCNAGSYVPVPHEGDDTDVYPVKPIEMLLAAQKRILDLSAAGKITVCVVGGGPSALEIAGNIWRLVKNHGRNRARIQVFAGKRFLSRFPEKVRRMALESLAHRGIEVHESGHVKEVASGGITLETGGRYPADIIFMAVGVTPSPIFSESGLPTGPEGGLLVNEYLQSTKHPEIFGGGDCIHFRDRRLDKVGVYAVRENPVLYANLMASLEGRTLTAFDPGGDYMLVFNLGDGTGILKKKWMVIDGKLAFRIKDHIDRKFMRKFQAIE